MAKKKRRMDKNQLLDIGGNINFYCGGGQGQDLSEFEDREMCR